MLCPVIKYSFIASIGKQFVKSRQWHLISSAHTLILLIKLLIIILLWITKGAGSNFARSRENCWAIYTGKNFASTTTIYAGTTQQANY